MHVYHGLVSLDTSIDWAKMKAVHDHEFVALCNAGHSFLAHTPTAKRSQRSQAHTKQTPWVAWCLVLPMVSSHRPIACVGVTRLGVATPCPDPVTMPPGGALPGDDPVRRAHRRGAHPGRERRRAAARRGRLGHAGPPRATEALAPRPPHQVRAFERSFYALAGLLLQCSTA